MIISQLFFSYYAEIGHDYLKFLSIDTSSFETKIYLVIVVVVL